MSSASVAKIGAIEAGGTKTICAIESVDGEITESVRFPTRDPKATLNDICSFFRSFENIASIGLGSFGPINLDAGSEHFGEITSTPKPGWEGYPIKCALENELKVPVAVMSDVETAALAEAKWGSGRNVDHLAYVTIGTGIGCGVISGGEVWRGRRHSEVGHYYPRKHALDKDFEGVCPYHTGCIEGLASGPAIVARTGMPGSELPADHPVWVIVGDYIAQLCVMLSAVVAPDMIVLGGGVMSSEPLINVVRSKFLDLNSNYHGVFDDFSVRDYIVRPTLQAPGLVGAMALSAQSIGVHWAPKL